MTIRKNSTIAFVFAIVLTIMAAFCLYPQEVAAKSDTVSFECKHIGNYAPLFYTTSGKPKFEGTCCDVLHSNSPGKATMERLGQKEKRVRVAYKYRSWLKDVSHKPARPGGGNFNKHAMLKFMLQYLTHKNATIKSNHFSQTTINDIEYYIDEALKDVDEAPPRFVCCLFSPTDNSQQFIGWHIYDKSTIQVIKTSSKPKSLKDSNFSLKNVVIKVYKKNKKADSCIYTFKCTEKYKKADGRYVSPRIEVEPKCTYYAKETDLGDAVGYKLNKKWYKKSVQPGKDVEFTVENYVNEPSITVHKTTDLSEEEESEDYYVGKIKIRIYKENPDGEDTLITPKPIQTDDDGDTEPITVEPGRYYAVEDPEDNPDIAEKGWELTERKVSETKQVTTEPIDLTIENTAIKGSLYVQKVFYQEDENGNIVQELSPAGFEFHAMNDDTGEELTPQISGDDGIADFGTVPFGRYYVWEELTQEQIDDGVVDLTREDNDGDGAICVDVTAQNAHGKIEGYTNVRRPALGNIETFKVIVNKDGEPIDDDPDGFEFTLTQTQGNAVGRTYTSKTKDGGLLGFYGIEPGFYTLKENLTPKQKERYDAIKDIHNIEVIAHKTKGISDGTPQYDYLPNPILTTKAYVKKVVLNDKGQEVGDASGFYFTLTSKDTPANPTVRLGPTNEDGYTPKIELKPGAYTVTEEAREGYKSQTEPFDVNIEKGEVKEIGPWKNVKDENGYVYVKKELSEDSAPGGSREGFSFILKNTNNPSEKFTLGPTNEDGVTDKIKIPAGWYDVTEDKPENAKYHDVTGPQTIEVKAENTIDNPKVITYKNRYDDPGKVKIRKTLSPDSESGGTAKNFQFVIKNNDTGAEIVKYSNKEVNGGYETDWVEELPPGSYTVTEVITDGNYQSVTNNPQTFTLEPGQSKEVSWVNKYKSTPSKIKIIKKLASSDGSGTVVGFKFNIYKKVGNNWELFRSVTTKQEDVNSSGEAVIANIEVAPNETYRVEEELTPEQEEQYERVGGPQTRTISSGEEAVFAFTNQTGDKTFASIQKVLTEDSDPNGKVKDFKFVMANTNGDPSSVYELNLTDDSGVTSISDIPYGTYKITEVLSDGQKVNYTDITGQEFITLSKTHKSESIVWKNRYNDVGNIKVIKQLTEDSSHGGKVSGFRFRIEKENDSTFTPIEEVSGNNGEINVSGLKFGRYTITELLTNEQKKYYSSETPSPQTVELTKEHPNGTVYWKNRFENLGNIRIKKVIVSDSPNADNEPLNQFKFDILSTSARGKNFQNVYMNNDGVIEINEVPFGTYKVYEKFTDAQKKKYKSITINPQVIEVTEDNPTAYVRWTNEFDDGGDITLYKTLSEDSTAGGTVEGFSFTFRDKVTGEEYITEETDESGKISLKDVPYGTYVVTENLTNTQKKYYKDLTESQEVTLDQTIKEQTISWTNRYEKDNYEIQIKKEVVGSSADPNDTFQFVVSLSNLDESDTGNGYEVPEYTVYRKSASGEIIPVTARPSSVINENHTEIAMNIKDGQYGEITGIASNVKYTITEKKNDYVPSYRVTQLEGTVPKTEDSGKSNKDLSTGEGVLHHIETGNKRVVYLFTNGIQTDPPTNEVEITKKITDGNLTTNFEYTANLSKLEKNSPYILLEEGSTRYTLSISSNGGTVKNDSNAGIAGVPVSLKRSDGKAKLVRSGAGGNIDLSDLEDWMQQTNGVITVSFLNQEGTFNYGATNLTLNTSDYNIKTFNSDANGNGSVEFLLKAEQKAWIPALPEKSKYTITEAGNKYIPSYEITRHFIKSGAVSKLSKDTGDAREDLTTTEETMPILSNVIDSVEFTNSTDTTRLRVTKTVTNAEGEHVTGDDTIFDYVVNLTGLQRDSYLLAVPGNETIKLETTRSGNMKVTVVNSELFANRDLSGIPVRIIRSDGEARTLYTDSNGEISSDMYTEWLKKGKGDNFDYTVDFMNQTVKGTFAGADITP